MPPILPMRSLRRRDTDIGALHVLPELPVERRSAFQLFVDELRELRRRILAFAYHCRETNLALLLRKAVDAGQDSPEHVVAELLAVMSADQANMGSDDLAPVIELLRADPLEFANTYFRPTSLPRWGGYEDTTSRGYNSVTSR